MKSDEVGEPRGIRESWRSEERGGDALKNARDCDGEEGQRTLFQESYQMKVNESVMKNSIRSIIPSETLIMHEPCIADFFVNGESAGVVGNIKILEDWLLHIDCLLEKAECEKSMNLTSFYS